MKINQKILSIPPYVSTSWKNVVSLHKSDGKKGPILIIGLVNGSTIEVPGIAESILNAIFEAHASYLEKDASTPENTQSAPPMFSPSFGEDATALLSMPMNMDGSMAGMMQHNSEASDSPDLPPEILEKITAVTKAVGMDSVDNLPKPEPHCNCMHCQIMRSLRASEDGAGSQHDEDKEEEELVTEEDLRFKEWEVSQKSEALFQVTNPLDEKEQYDVFLGTPVGCTCGNKNCEHIRAALNS